MAYFAWYARWHQVVKAAAANRRPSQIRPAGGISIPSVQALTIAEVADELYSLSPAEFTAARDDRARELRAAGQRELSAEIKKLARPTASAWLVNQLARRAPDELTRLFDVGDALHEAQRTLAGDRLRELSSQRRQVVADLLPVAATLAEDAGQPASAAVLGEVRATLEAALADPQAGDAVRSGHLTKALAYAGLGEVDLTAALALPAEAVRRAGRAGRGKPSGGAAGRSGKERDGTTHHGTATGRPATGAHGVEAGGDQAGGEQADGEAGLERQDPGRLLAEAETAADNARVAVDLASRRVTGLAEQRKFLGRRVDHLKRELEQAKAEETQLARDVRQAERELADATREHESAQRKLSLARRPAKGGG